MVLKRGNKSGQLTIFIIIAILLVAIVIGFYIFKGDSRIAKVPRDFEPIYNNFLTCEGEVNKIF